MRVWGYHESFSSGLVSRENCADVPTFLILRSVSFKKFRISGDRSRMVVAMLWLVAAMQVGCEHREPPLRIAAASSTRYLIDSLVAVYERETGIVPEVVIASSGKLIAQIRQGAPFDLMLSADLAYPEELVASGLVQGGVYHYCTGQLALWSLQEMSGGIAGKLHSAQKIAIANPDLAPYGKAAREVLMRLQLWEQMQDKIVFGESIGQVNQFVLAGAADVGFTTQSVARAKIVRGRGHWEAIDRDMHAPLRQGLVVLRNGQIELAQDFVSFLKGEQANVLFESFGYLLPDE